MMELIRFATAAVLFTVSLLSLSASAFSGEFEISGLEVDAPFQADPKSIENSTVSCKWIAWLLSD